MLLYSITWPLTSNFQHPVKKKILLPAKFHFNPNWGNFYNMFFSFKKGLYGQSHSSSDSQHHIKILLPAKFPISQGFPQVLQTWAWIDTWGEIGGRGFKMLLKNTCEGVYMLVKLLAISLQACKFTKMNFFTYKFQRF